MTVEHTAEELEAAARFSVPDGATVFVTRDVMENGEPLREAHHYEDGDWWFSSGRVDLEDEEMIVVACLPCVLREHPGVADLADLRAGWDAISDERGQWVRRYAA